METLMETLKPVAKQLRCVAKDDVEEPHCSEELLCATTAGGTKVQNPTKIAFIVAARISSADNDNHVTEMHCNRDGNRVKE